MYFKPIIKTKQTQLQYDIQSSASWLQHLPWWILHISDVDPGLFKRFCKFATRCDFYLCWFIWKWFLSLSCLELYDDFQWRSGKDVEGRVVTCLRPNPSTERLWENTKAPIQDKSCPWSLSDYKNRSLWIRRCDHYLCHTSLHNDQYLTSETKIDPGTSRIRSRSN